MQRHLDDGLNQLKDDILRMATLTEESIHKTVEALNKKDKNLAESIIFGDRDIDELENKIQQEAVELLALFQPLAKDLRFITTAMHVSDELERIADLIVNICQRIMDLADQSLLKPAADIPQLIENAKKMVKNSIDAFVNYDEDLAKEVILADKESNQLRNMIMRDLVNEHMVKDGTTATIAVPLLLMARDLERISDHAASIAEDVIYMIQAKMVRHHPERLDNGDKEDN